MKLLNKTLIRSNTTMSTSYSKVGPDAGPYAGNVLNSPRKGFVELSLRLRAKRMALFQSLIASLPRPLSILDVGGTQIFWNTMGPLDDVSIVLYNLEAFEVTAPNIISMVGDARDMHEFEDKKFDVVFSNSVIDHLGTLANQRKMAKEIQRVADHYFVQVPNRYFPIEPHFILPFFQFLPLNVRIFLASHVNGWGKAYEIKDKKVATEFVSGIRLMSEKELREAFPGAKIYKEKFLGLTKSLIVYKF